jgi:hypothetical protein
MASKAYVVHMRGVIIGRSDLERTSPSGARAGRFHPGPGYDLVQPVFRLFAEATTAGSGETVDAAKLARYTKARDALLLELRDAAGRALATRSIRIVDRVAELGSDALELEVILDEPRPAESR